MEKKFEWTPVFYDRGLLYEERTRRTDEKKRDIYGGAWRFDYTFAAIKGDYKEVMKKIGNCEEGWIRKG